MSTWFDIERTIEETKLPEEMVQSILKEVREEFPDDDMMYELHVIRALQAELRQRLGDDAWREQVMARTEHLHRPV